VSRSQPMAQKSTTSYFVRKRAPIWQRSAAFEGGSPLVNCLAFCCNKKGERAKGEISQRSWKKRYERWGVLLDKGTGTILHNKKSLRVKGITNLPVSRGGKGGNPREGVSNTNRCRNQRKEGN